MELNLRFQASDVSVILSINIRLNSVFALL